MNKGLNKRRINFGVNSSTLIILMVLFVLTAIFQKNFFEARALTNTVNAIAPLALLAMGQAVVMISGGIDMSAGNSMALILCVCTQIMKADQPITGIYAIVVCILLSIAIGLVNGIAVGYLRLPAIIATFATSYTWLGIALFVTPTAGGEAVNWFKIFYDVSKVDDLPAWAVTIGKLLPPGLVLVLLGCLAWWIISHKRLGRHIYAVGSSGDNAYATGINTGAVQTKAYIINALFACACAFFYAGQNGAGSARVGDAMTLQSISAAVVGGIALSGGRGSIFMVIAGAAILQFINKIIFFSDISNAYQTLVSGVIVIMAVASSYLFDMLHKRRLLKGEVKSES